MNYLFKQTYEVLQALLDYIETYVFNKIGAAGGLATLNEDGKVPNSQIGIEPMTQAEASAGVVEDGRLISPKVLATTIAEKVSPVAVEVEALDERTDNINERLETVEQLAEISIGGGDIGIATAEDFDDPSAAQRAKVPTVGAILDCMDEVPTPNSVKPVQSGGVNVTLENLSKKTLEKILTPMFLNYGMWCDWAEVGSVITSRIPSASGACLSYIACKKGDLFSIEYTISNNSYSIEVLISEEVPTIAGVSMEVLYRNQPTTSEKQEYYFSVPKDGYLIVRRIINYVTCKLYQYTNIRKDAERYETTSRVCPKSLFEKNKKLIIDPNSPDYGKLVAQSPKTINYGVSDIIDVSEYKYIGLYSYSVSAPYYSLVNNNGCAFYGDDYEVGVDETPLSSVANINAASQGGTIFVVAIPEGAKWFRLSTYFNGADWARTIVLYGPDTLSDKEREAQQQLADNTRNIDELLSSEIRFTEQHIPYVGVDGWKGASTLQEFISRKKADMFVNCRWTPKGAIPWSTRSLSVVNYYEEGVEYKGIPYSSNIDHAKWLGTHVSLYTFMTAVNNKYSLLYTECLKNGNTRSAWGYEYTKSGNGSTYYGTVCCGFTSYVTKSNVVWNNPQFYSLPSMFTLIQPHTQSGHTFNMNLLRIGDILDDGGHSYMIYDINYQDGEVVNFSGMESTSGVDEVNHIAKGSRVRPININSDLSRFDHFRYNYFYCNTEMRTYMDDGVWVDGQIDVNYNDDICTIAGDRAVFSTESVIALNFNLDDRVSFPYDTIVVRNITSGTEQSYIIANIDWSSYDSSQHNHALKLEGITGGKYEAWCKNSTTDAVSEKTSFIVVSQDDITVQTTEDGIVASLTNKSYRIGGLFSENFNPSDYGNEPYDWVYSTGAGNGSAVIQNQQALLRPNDISTYDKNAGFDVTIYVITEFGTQRMYVTI